ncbi:MAG: DUF4465 domain-containing protein [Bacteroidota bacterium]|nr:DUF4465 domain-containing protein [Bacteroidota bacterium]MDX5430555.1 DUF4465 domain-containing protein [Bacteroidota bacterium]MDX5469307.1 DUF4465 domain-containing protein [Bacteroidota bacterium]
MKKLLFSLFTLFAADAFAQATDSASFENYSLPNDSFDNGSSGTLLFEDNGVKSPVFWDTAWGGYWAGGWALSNQTDSTREGTDGLYQSITGTASHGSNYLVGQNGSELIWPGSNGPNVLESISVTNTSYTYYSLKNGDAFAKKFGGIDGTDPDYLILHITGKRNGSWINDTIDFYLADFRSADPNQDYIVTEWETIDMVQLSIADTLHFFMTSSDTGDFGINTPTFFCFDNLIWTIQVGLNSATKESIRLYPNPAQNHLVAEGVHSWTIYTIQGVALLNGESENIDIRNLKPGTYVIRDQEGRSSRFIKQ